MILETDASQAGLGWVLYQVLPPRGAPGLTTSKDPWAAACDKEGYIRLTVRQLVAKGFRVQVVTTGGRSLRAMEERYAPRELEACGIVSALVDCQFYLWDDAKLSVRTDHQSLQWAFNNPNQSSRVGRWALVLSSYQYKCLRTTHVPGRDHSVADGISRHGGFAPTAPNAAADEITEVYAVFGDGGDRAASHEFQLEAGEPGSVPDTLAEVEWNEMIRSATGAGRRVQRAGGVSSLRQRGRRRGRQRQQRQQRR